MHKYRLQRVLSWSPVNTQSLQTASLCDPWKAMEKQPLETTVKHNKKHETTTKIHPKIKFFSSKVLDIHAPTHPKPDRRRPALRPHRLHHWSRLPEPATRQRRIGQGVKKQTSFSLSVFDFDIMFIYLFKISRFLSIFKLIGKLRLFDLWGCEIRWTICLVSFQPRASG